MIRFIFLLFSFILPFWTFGQEMAMGDSLIVNSIKNKTFSIYNNKDTVAFFLTKHPLQKRKTYGMSIAAYMKNDSINRIVTSATTPEGIVSSEYYLEQERLIFSYITFEYFDEVKAITTRENFKGIRSWESRYYFTNSQVIYQTHSGIKEKSAIYPPSEILQDQQSILKYIKGRIRH